MLEARYEYRKGVFVPYSVAIWSDGRYLFGSVDVAFTRRGIERKGRRLLALHAEGHRVTWSETRGA